jgi:hypothetical protein
MPSPSIIATHSKALNDIQILENYRNDSKSLEPKFQHFIAEVVVIRLFSIIENCVRETALKVACQATYRNGTLPSLTLICRSTIDAENQFINYNRSRPERLKWTKASFIHKSTKEVIPLSEEFRVQVNNYAAFLNEIRRVRNHVAHRTDSTRKEYKNVLRHVFGAYLKIQPGAFLTSTKRLSNPKIDSYIVISRIMINDITNG